MFSIVTSICLDKHKNNYKKYKSELTSVLFANAAQLANLEIAKNIELKEQETVNKFLEFRKNQKKHWQIDSFMLSCIYMSNNNTVIKDMQNRTIGSIKEQGTVTRLNDRYNRTVATYNKSTDTTVDTRTGQAIGRGNQLLRVKI